MPFFCSQTISISKANPLTSEARAWHKEEEEIHTFKWYPKRHVSYLMCVSFHILFFKRFLFIFCFYATRSFWRFIVRYIPVIHTLGLVTPHSWQSITRDISRTKKSFQSYHVFLRRRTDSRLFNWFNVLRVNLHNCLFDKKNKNHQDLKYFSVEAVLLTTCAENLNLLCYSVLNFSLFSDVYWN